MGIKSPTICGTFEGDILLLANSNVRTRECFLHCLPADA